MHIQLFSMGVNWSDIVCLMEVYAMLYEFTYCVLTLYGSIVLSDCWCVNSTNYYCHVGSLGKKIHFCTIIFLWCQNGVKFISPCLNSLYLTNLSNHKKIVQVPTHLIYCTWNKARNIFAITKYFWEGIAEWRRCLNSWEAYFTWKKNR